MASSTYSFVDIQAAIKGPNGSFSLGNGSGAAEEGMTISQIDDKSSLTMGADGTGMHSLHASKAGTVTIRLLKTSPVNAQLMDMYNADTSSAALFGQNTILIRNPVSGDNISAAYCGWRKVPDLSYAKDGNTHEWVFNSPDVSYLLGVGTPSVVF